MKPWIILAGISLIMDFFNILKAVATLALADALFSTLIWVLWAYFFLVIWSFKAEVEEGTMQGGTREEREMMKV